MSRRTSEDGAVTAEAAVVLPVLVILVAAFAWLVTIGVSQVRAVDAARETARALARGEDPVVSEGYGRRIAPHGAIFRIRSENGEVLVEVRAQVHGPGGLFGFLPGFDAHGTAVARAEP